MKINKEYIKRNIARIPRFFRQWRLYNFSVAFWTFIVPFSQLSVRLEIFSNGQKHRCILQYLYKRYVAVIDPFIKKDTAIESLIESDATIWVCWWDGEESMPKLVNACYNSIKQYAGTHPVKLITKHNFRDFISIPEYILEKVNTGIMTVTHFSNILRANLLYDYGGIWMDATILVLKNISLENLPFYTLKAPAKKSSSVTLTRFSGISNLSMHLHDKSNPQISRWSGFLFAGRKHSIVFEYMREILYAYWKDHNDQIDYLLYDYTIALGYDNISIIKKLIDNVPCSDAEKFVLEKNMNTEFSEEKFAQYALIPFHKLTWKMKFDVYTKDNKLTMYGYILNTFLNQDKDL